jgi:hypothetical protein
MPERRHEANSTLRIHNSGVPVILAVIWHFLLDACEMKNILYVMGLERNVTIMLKISHAMVKNLVAPVTRLPGFVHPCSTVYVNYFSEDGLLPFLLMRKWKRTPPHEFVTLALDDGKWSAS